MEKSILALDLGSIMGWATPQASGTVEFKNGRFEGGGMRFLKFRNWLSGILETLGGVEALEAIYFEEVANHNGVAAAHCYGGFMGHLTAFCEEKGIPYSGVPVGTIKKFATGKGNANKKMMIEAAIQLGYSPADDNEADAIHLLRYVLDGKLKLNFKRKD